MKKLVFLSFMAIATLMTSCSEGSEEKQSGDVVKDEIMTFLSYYDQGLRHSSPIEDVKKFDKSATDYLVGENFIGYQSKKENGVYDVSKTYNTVHNDKKVLDRFEMMIVVKEEFEYDENDKEMHPVDRAKYVEMLNEKLGKDKHELFNGNDQWNIDGATIQLSQSIGTSAIEMSIAK